LISLLLYIKGAFRFL